MSLPPLPTDVVLLNARPYVCGSDNFSLVLRLLCFSGVYALCPCEMFQTSPSLILPSAPVEPGLGHVPWGSGLACNAVPAPTSH